MLNKEFGMIRDAEKAFLKCVETATQKLTSKDEELYIKLIAASQEELDKL